MIISINYQHFGTLRHMRLAAGRAQSQQKRQQQLEEEEAGGGGGGGEGSKHNIWVTKTANDEMLAKAETETRSQKAELVI